MATEVSGRLRPMAMASPGTSERPRRWRGRRRADRVPRPMPRTATAPAALAALVALAVAPAAPAATAKKGSVAGKLGVSVPKGAQANLRVINRADLVAAVWGEEQSVGVSDQALDALIRRLRDRLSSLDPTHQYIDTVRGHGVRLDNPPA